MAAHPRKNPHHGHKPHFLPITGDDLDLARAGHDPAIERIRSSLIAHLRFGRGSFLPEDDIEDIACSALADAWHLVQLGHDHRSVVAALTTGLSRHLQRVKRLRKKMRTGHKLHQEQSTGHDTLGTALDLDNLFGVVHVLRHLMPKAVHGLNDAYHDLIADAYGLDAYGVRRRLPHPVLIRTESARAKALQRARKAFNTLLERRILDELVAGTGDAVALRGALEFVRGGMRIPLLGQAFDRLTGERGAQD